MPMHDWTRVDAGIYHDFHGVWLYQIRHALNNGGLPPGYYALQDQVVRPFQPDVIALRTGPDRPPPGGGTRASAHPPAVGVIATARRVTRKKGHRRVSVRHVSGHQVVALIELVSPGSKSAKRDFTEFVYKAADVIEDRVNVLLIDPFPPTPRDPAGVHAAVWKELTRKPFAPPAGKPLTAASYAPGPDFLAFVEPFAVGEPVPTMPLFLNPDEYVNMPLEATYAAAWAEVPAVWRAILDGA